MRKSEDDEAVRKLHGRRPFDLTRVTGILLAAGPETKRVVPVSVVFIDRQEYEDHLARKRREMLTGCPENQRWPGYPDDPDDPPWPVEEVRADQSSGGYKARRKDRFSLAILRALAGQTGWTRTKDVAALAGLSYSGLATKPLTRLYRAAFVDRLKTKVHETGLSGWKSLQVRITWRITDRGRTKLSRLEAEQC